MFWQENKIHCAKRGCTEVLLIKPFNFKFGLFKNVTSAVWLCWAHMFLENNKLDCPYQQVLFEIKIWFHLFISFLHIWLGESYWEWKPFFSLVDGDSWMCSNYCWKFSLNILLYVLIYDLVDIGTRKQLVLEMLFTERNVL